MFNIFKDALLTTKKIPFFDRDMCKLDFIHWLLDFEEYFNFWKIFDEERVRLASNKLDDEAKKWWKDIQIYKKWRGKHLITLGKE